MINKRLSLPDLPYPYEALEPIISKQTLEIHHDKHHLAYVKGANDSLEKLENSRNEETEIDIKGILKDLSFNYNGAILHQMFWENMRPAKETNEPIGEIKTVLEKNFDSFGAFKNEFSKTAITVEGSGWAVLWMDEEKNLMVNQVEKHNLLGMNGFKPLLVLDVWEHAYYLQYQNRRPDFVENWWRVVNWEDVEKRYQGKKISY